MFEDIDLLQLSSEQQTELRFLEKFFDSKEWKHLTDELDFQIKNEKDRCVLAGTWEENRVATGRLLAYHSIRGYPAAIQAKFYNIALASAGEVLDQNRDNELEHE